jgi:hypothetical protein
MLRNLVRFLVVASAEGVIGYVASQVVIAGVESPQLRDIFLVAIWPLLIVSGTVMFVAWVWSGRPLVSTVGAPRDGSEAQSVLSHPASVPATHPIAQPANREFVPPSVTPLFLMSFFEGHTTAQGQQSVARYIGKWLTFSGTVSNVQVFDTAAVVTSYVDRSNPSVLEITISMWFLMSNKERVRLLSRGDPIVVSGRIERLASLDIELRDCELVSS